MLTDILDWVSDIHHLLTEKQDHVKQKQTAYTHTVLSILVVPVKPL